MADATSRIADLSETLLHPVLDDRAQAVFVTRLNTRHIVFWSRKAETLLGYSHRELVGWTPSVLFPDPIAFRRFYETAEQILQWQRSWRTTLQLQKRNRQIISTEITVSRLGYTDSSGAFLLNVIHDRAPYTQMNIPINARVA